MDNPFFLSFDTPFQSIPFHKIKQEDFEPAILRAIEEARKEVDQIVASAEEPSFENTIVALERTGKRLSLCSAAFFNIASAETNDYIEKVQEKVSPILAAYGNDLILNKGLFERINSVFENSDRSGLSQEDLRLLEKTHRGFTRNGALLPLDKQQTLRDIDQRLAMLQVKFAQNVLQETNAYRLVVKDEEDLAGLPESIRNQAKEEAKKQKLDGWVFTLQFPSYIPFLKYAKNRELRREIYLASASRSLKDNEFNNESVIKDIVALRHERAGLLRFDSHADFVLAERMAKSPEVVRDFLEELLIKAKPFALQEIEALKDLAKEDGISELMPYDHAYYAEKLRERRFSYSEEALKPYFPLERVLEAAFLVAGKLFGLTFKKNMEVPVYHEEVSVYEVLEEESHKALLYVDWHPREGKRAGAWMTSYKGQSKDEMGNHRPHVSIVCNFSRPTAEIPALLTFQEVTTLFHEFGHALHGILADTTYESLSGTNVYWDFVELPSQFMENYCYQKEFLKTFARHYQSDEPLPDSEIEKIVASANFMEGYQTVRQLSFGLLDFAYHTGIPLTDSIEDFEQEVTKATQMYPRIPGTAQSTAFSHIFAGGYAAGYYSYKWSEVLDADAFAFFKETGIFNEATAAKLKVLLEKGGTEDPMELYMAFRGREPKIDALLERAGLDVSSSPTRP